jgi:hypothetical protein
MIELHDRAKFEANSRSPKEENRLMILETKDPPDADAWNATFCIKSA